MNTSTRKQYVYVINLTSIVRMNNTILAIPLHKSRSMTLIIILGFSLVAFSLNNLENHKAIATTIINQTNTQTYVSTSDSNTKEFTLIAEETTLDISPSKKIKAWTYNGSIPGPTLRVTEGDKAIVHFMNKLDLLHTVHFHGGHNGTMDGVFEIVAPNKTFTYEFTAAPSGALMYHCHVMPVVEHVRMGLYGAFIVDPKTPLPPAKEFVVVFGDYDTKDIHTSDPESAFYNGYENIYYDNPLPVYTNETARVYMINLSQLPA